MKIPSILWMNILNFKKVKFIYICSKLVLESLAHKVDIHILIYLLTYSMVQSPSWEANWFGASQEIPRISRNPKVHYRTYKHLPPVSILGQPNPVHTSTSYTSWRSILILSTHLRLGLPSRLSPSGFPSKTLYTPSPHPYAPHAQPISFFSISRYTYIFLFPLTTKMYFRSVCVCNVTARMYQSLSDMQWCGELFFVQ